MHRGRNPLFLNKCYERQNEGSVSTLYLEAEAKEFGELARKMKAMLLEKSSTKEGKKVRMQVPGNGDRGVTCPTMDKRCTAGMGGRMIIGEGAKVITDWVHPFSH